MGSKTPVIAISGYSDSGKTSLLLRIIERLTAKGYKIGVIKHHQHSPLRDKPTRKEGSLKDTQQFLKAGAVKVVLLEGEVNLDDEIGKVDQSDLDLLMVEGFKSSTLPKFYLLKNDIITKQETLKNVLGYVSSNADDRLGFSPWYQYNEPEAIVDYIERIMKGEYFMVTITLNGVKMEVREDESLLTIARANGIDIPTLCHNEKLKLFSGCRLCVMEVNVRKNLAAGCATKPLEGMVVQTHSDRVMQARKDILDLLVSNHPEDLVGSTKIGNNDFQKYAIEYGITTGSYQGDQRHYELDEANPAYIRDPNKCILCGKCVSTCDQIQISHTIDFLGKGFDTKVAPAFDLPISIDNCRLCGQCVSACPTGALIHKQLKDKNPKNITKVRTTCPFCGTGCNFDLNVEEGKVIGVTPIDEATVNSSSLCVKGRYHTDMLTSKARLTTPLIRKDGILVPGTYEEAFDLIAKNMLDIKEKYGADSLASLSSARCTNEDNFIFQKLFRVGFGTNNIDHCART